MKKAIIHIIDYTLRISGAIAIIGIIASSIGDIGAAQASTSQWRGDTHWTHDSDAHTVSWNTWSDRQHVHAADSAQPTPAHGAHWTAEWHDNTWVHAWSPSLSTGTGHWQA